MRHLFIAFIVLLVALSADALACPEQGETKRIAPSTGDVVLAFGQQAHPILQVPKFHPGVDYAAFLGDLVRAAGAGEVIFANRDGEFGNTVAVMHGGGVETRYGHLSRIAVAVGDCVSAGTIIGSAGSTGLSASPRGTLRSAEEWETSRSTDLRPVGWSSYVATHHICRHCRCPRPRR